MESTEGTVVIFHNRLALIWNEVVSVKQFIENLIRHSRVVPISCTIEFSIDRLRRLLEIFIVNIRGLRWIDS